MPGRAHLALESPDGPRWSRRQRAVLGMLEERCSTGQMAERLHVKPAEARRRVDEILAILDAESRDEAGE